MNDIARQSFEAQLGRAVSRHYRDKAVALLDQYGPRLSALVTCAILWAVDQGKLPMVLGMLQGHYDAVFASVPVGTAVSSSTTPRFFASVFRETLGVEPAY